MENSKQTQLSLEESTTLVKQQPWWFYPLAILCVFLFGGIAWAIAGDGETDQFQQKLATWQQEYNEIQNKKTLDDIALCEKEREGATLKLQANSAYPTKYTYSVADATNLMWKRNVDNCKQSTEVNYMAIPQAKALSFETNSSEIPNSSILTFLPPNNDSNNNGHSDRASEHTNILPVVLHNVPVPQVATSKALDLDKLAHAVSVAETSGCTKGSAKYNNCYGIKYKGAFAHYKTPEASTDDFKRIWTKSYKIFPTSRLATKWTGNDKPDTWLATVNAHYYE